MNSSNSVKEALENVIKKKSLGFNESFELARICSIALSNKDTEDLAREILIRVLDKRIDSHSQSMWNDLIEASGLYPYADSKYLKGSAILRHEYHRSRYLPNVIFHREQESLSFLLQSNQSLILSAPTSFGKSLLIEEIVASRRHKNMVIVQPTLALLEETRKKLKKYSDYYNLIVSTRQEASLGPNLFLFTAERVVEYENLPRVNFFIIDEFYKLSIDRNDDRSYTLNHAFYKLLKHTRNFYLLGPNIHSIPKGFESAYGSKFFKTNFSTVAVDVYDLALDSKEEKKEKELFALLKDLKEPTLIYCSSPDKANLLLKKFLNHSRFKTVAANDDIVEWIAENVHKEWILLDALKKGIAVHHGALPRHLSSSIVDKFNEGMITHLFCTSTLIEGVNTSAKNVVLYHKTRGRKPIDYFDYKNIAGRSGRMNKHFIGRVFRFNPEPKQIELDIDIPIFTQKKEVPLDLLIQMEENDLTAASKAKLKIFHDLSSEDQELVKQNKGAPVEGQLQLILLLRKNPDLYPLLNWKTFPKYKQLEKVLELSWKHLLSPKENKGGVRTFKQLTFITFQYATYKSIPAIINILRENDYWKAIENDSDMRLQKVINFVLQSNRHWFEYKLPKLLSIISNIQDHVYKRLGFEPGNYSYFSAQIENSFLPANLSVLADYGVPISTIKKIGPLLAHKESIEAMIKEIRTFDFKKVKLLKYEQNKIKSLL